MKFHPTVVVGLLAALGVFTLAWNLGGRPVDDLMEARNLVTAREMADTGAWLIPTMNGSIRLAKPPLPTWGAAAVGQHAGFRNLGALRMPTCLVAFLGALAVTLYARRLGSSVGYSMVAGLVLLSTFLYARHGRIATWDVPTHAFAMAGIAAFAQAAYARSARWAVASAFAFGAMFMSKGPVAMWALVAPWLVAFALCDRTMLVARRRDVAIVVVLTVLVASAWPLYVYLHDPASCRAVLTQETQAWVNRHVRSAWSYAGFPVYTGVWIPLALTVLVSPIWFRGFAARREVTATLIWLWLCWIIIAVVPTKKERYMIPILFPLAILVARWLEIEGASGGRGARRAMQAQTWFAGIACIAGLVATPVLYLIGRVPFAGACVAGLLLLAGLGGWFAGLRCVRSAPARVCVCSVAAAAGLMAAAYQVQTELEGMAKHVAPAGLEDAGRRGGLERAPLFAHRAEDIYLVWDMGRPLLKYPDDLSGLEQAVAGFRARSNDGLPGSLPPGEPKVDAGWLSEFPPESDEWLRRFPPGRVKVVGTEEWTGWSGKRRLYCSSLRLLDGG